MLERVFLSRVVGFFNSYHLLELISCFNLPLYAITIIIVLLKAYICILYDVLCVWQRIQWGLSCPES